MATVIHRVHARLSPLEFLFLSHPKWPLPSLPSSSSTSIPLRMSVLDSSFNPPTLAHLALANSRPPGDDRDYDARLLLLSVRNADKTLKPGDASYIQRLEMMRLLSDHITTTPNNVAVAIVNEPTFVGKSTQLLSFLKQRFTNMADSDNIYCPSVQLTFVLGFDTLERLFAPRYYGSAEQMLLALRNFFSPAPVGEDCYVVCANRAAKVQTEHPNPGSDLSDFMQYAQEFIDSGRIVMVDIGVSHSTYSSTAVRNAIKSEDPGWKSYVTDSIAQYIIQNNLYTNPQ
ncbi:hypothetical protein AX15_002008 [Amanita polypyramis BW_CC]|nr:hypothetical protein AX15_002008 [Amanita polypyramis BW_CC]